MTAQTSESFIYKGKRLVGLCSEPLRSYLDKNGIEWQGGCSACWRGYEGSWKVDDDGRLYLYNLQGVHLIIKSDKRAISFNHEIDVSTLFPNKNHVFAEWYSGEVKLVEKIIFEHGDYYHDNYPKIYTLTFENGILIKENLMVNQNLVKGDSIFSRFIKQTISQISQTIFKK
ncbi:hypothetical protein [Sphingobacterium deserti]|uniref:Uncharacterized protein n=1 Tax=Sphingobacterium deserti TaxID=1229276 RepID=A0A0B8TCF2_9SPHI|nr:hypothetical protein [Sphingobacterium deserti]KGE16075.1 hypothetical protein DI53_0190 [Sphingobacterium deserti]